MVATGGVLEAEVWLGFRGGGQANATKERNGATQSTQ